MLTKSSVGFEKSLESVHIGSVKGKFLPILTNLSIENEKYISTGFKLCLSTDEQKNISG